MKPPNGFPTAVAATPSRSKVYRAGLQALRGRDHQFISSKKPRMLTGSVDLDSAMQPSPPNTARWDYLIGVESSADDHVACAEIHPASTSEASIVVDKVRWLKAWLSGGGRAVGALPRHGGVYYSIATNGVSIPTTSPQFRRISQEGLVIRKHLSLP
jgi:hypothetical protein